MNVEGVFKIASCWAEEAGASGTSLALGAGLAGYLSSLMLLLAWTLAFSSSD